MLPGPGVIRKDYNPLPIRAGANAHRWWPHLNWGSSPGSIVKSPCRFHQPSEITKHCISWPWPWIVYFWEACGGRAVRECHLEIALVRTKEHCHLFSKRTCPRESWAILALVNGWNLSFFLICLNMYRYCHSPRIMRVVINILDMFC